MANKNQNTEPNSAGNNPTSTKEITDFLREKIALDGDYNNILKNQLREIDKLGTAYKNIEARLNSLNKSSINIKQVNQELYKLRQKDYIAAKNIEDVQANVSEETKKQIANAKSKNDFKKLEANLEFQALKAAENAVRVSKLNLEAGQAALENEKQVAKQMGITGNLAQKFAEKLGVGEEAYAAMSDVARKLVDQNGKVGGFASKLQVVKAGVKAGASAIKESFSDPVARGAAVVGAYKAVGGALTSVGNAAAKAGTFMAGLSEDSSSTVRGFTSGFSDMAKKIPLVGGAIGGLIDGFSAIADLALGVDNTIIKSGRELNLNTQEARALNREFQNMSFNSGNIFTNSKKLLQSQVELSGQLGLTNRLTQEQLETNIMLKDIAGLEADTRQQIVESSTITGKSSESIVKSVFAQVEGLKQATGIQFQNQKILKEAASLGGYLGLQFAKYPAQLTKSLVTVKAMGMELKELDSIADSFLDFESSISKEFEAQLLTGKEINLAKAREAFLNNDLATAASEITNQVGSAEQFLKLNRIQAESLASAFGMSRDQLGEMLKRQELLSKLGAKDTDNAREQLRLGLEKYKSQEALAEAVGEEAYQNLINASTQEKIAVFIEKIKQTIVDFVETSGIIEKIEGFINYISEPGTVKRILTTVRDVFADIAETVLAITNGVINVLDFLTFGAIDEGLERKLEALQETAPGKIRSMGGNFEALDIGTKAATSAVKSNGTPQPAPAASDNNMMMRGPQSLNISVRANIVQSSADAESHVSMGGFAEKQT
jgi:hypothetical protein